MIKCHFLLYINGLSHIASLNHRQPGSMLCNELGPHSTHVRTSHDSLSLHADVFLYLCTPAAF